MARLEANLTVKAGQDKEYLCSMGDNYTEVYQEIAKVDNADTFVTLASLSKTTPSLLKGSKLIVLKNNSPVGVELQFHINEFEDNSNIDAYTEDLRITQLLGANEYLVLPNQFMLGYSTDTSGGNAKTIDNATGYSVNSGKLYVDSVANLAEDVDGSETAIDVNDGDYFRVGDLIQLGTTTGTTATNIEIMRITGISTNTLTVERGLFGSITGNSASQTTGHANGAAVHFPWFNTQEKYDKYHDDANALGTAQTNSSGRYTAQNLFGYGRSATYPTGIVKGSFAMKFYNSGYQEFGMSGVTANTESGLAASTTYQFNITVDGGSTFANLAFTTDATNTNFGGNNGVLSKIQSALDTQFYTAGNLFEKGVTVSIVNGDIRFASTNRTRASAILLAAPSSGTTPFGVGRIPAIGDIESAVEALLPDDTVFDKATYIEMKNQATFAYDDGKGNIVGSATGTINYETGMLDFTGPANAEFVASFNYDSAHSGGLNDSSNQENGIITISARSVNSKINAEVELLGFV
tara:strand:- start:154 stop:1719 length:1566 start_codon:yes stop_codon:yes gene_type:complete